MADDSTGMDRLKKVIAERLQRVAELEAELGKHDPLSLEDAQALAEYRELDDEAANDEAATEPEQNPRALRKQYKDVGHRLRDLEARLASATAAPVADQLAEQGIDPRYARMYTSDDRSESAVNAWIAENKDLLGAAAPAETPAEEAYDWRNDPNAVAAVQIQSLGPGVEPTPYEPPLKRPKTIEQFTKLINDLPNDAKGIQAMQELGLITEESGATIMPNEPGGVADAMQGRPIRDKSW
jgi:hypothetical protein